MSTKDAIHVDYNLSGLRCYVLLYGTLLPLSALICVFIGAGVFHLVQNGVWGFCLLGLPLELIFICCMVYIYQDWSYYLGRLKNGGPAFAITKAGIEDYASVYRVGPLSWTEMERMYPWNREQRFFPNRFFATPLVRRDKCLVIRIKDPLNYLDRIPSTRAWQARIDASIGKGRYVVVPEALLSSPVDEVLKNLNQFYLSHVIGER